MTFYTLTRAGGPWVYQALGFTAVNGAVLDGSASTPAITSPPDQYWAAAGFTGDMRVVLLSALRVYRQTPGSP